MAMPTMGITEEVQTQGCPTCPSRWDQVLTGWKHLGEMWADFLTDGAPGTGYTLNNNSGWGNDKLSRKGPSSGILEVGHLIGPVQLSKTSGFLEGFEFMLNVESQRY